MWNLVLNTFSFKQTKVIYQCIKIKMYFKNYNLSNSVIFQVSAINIFFNFHKIMNIIRE